LEVDTELVRLHNSAKRLDLAKREIIAARLYEIPAEAIYEANGPRQER
jgi:peptidyl-tRNA hydrolase